MSDPASSFTHLKTCDNGDLVFYTDLENLDGLEYCCADGGTVYEIQAVPPPPDDPTGQHGVELRRFSLGADNEVCVQSLTLAEYPSQMAAQEHAHEIGQILLDEGLAGLEHDINRLDLLPPDTLEPVYMMGLYPPPAPGSDEVTLNLLRMGQAQVELAPIAHGSMDDVAAIEQRLFALQMEGDTDVFLKAATAEAVRAKTLAPNTPLFAAEGLDIQANPAQSWLEHLPPADWEDHPDWPDNSVWAEPPPPRPAAMVMPATFDDDLTPFDEQGHYVPHHIDADRTIHFMSVIPRPADSPLPDETTHELRYYRAQIDEEGLITHRSLPVMPVADPTATPWPLPTLQMQLEDGEVAAAQGFARDIARDFYGLDFPDPADLPVLGQGEPELLPEWYHYDAALVLATPQGVDDGYSVGVVDVYANHQDGQWAARYLPMGEFNTFDEALTHEQKIIQQRVQRVEADPTSSAGDFNSIPTHYEHIAAEAAEDALVDLIEQNDGQLPQTFDGDPEPEWERLTSREWDAYRDHLQVVTHAGPDTDPIRDNLPTATPQFASDELVNASFQPDAPYLQAADFAFEDLDNLPGVRSWDLKVVAVADAAHPGHERAGKSVVCVDFDGDLAAPGEARWLEVAQFQHAEDAAALVDDFKSLIPDGPLANANGPVLAELIAGGQDLNGEWQPMDAWEVADWQVGDWMTHHDGQSWQPVASAIPIADYERALFTHDEVRYPLAVWQLEVIPTQDPGGDPLGYSAVFVNHPVPNGPTKPQWLEIGQFETEDRAQTFKEVFQSSFGDESPIVGPELAELVAEEMHMPSTWQPLSATALDLLKTGEWRLTHEPAAWQPQIEDAQPAIEPETTEPAGPTLDL